MQQQKQVEQFLLVKKNDKKRAIAELCGELTLVEFLLPMSKYQLFDTNFPMSHILLAAAECL
jgi:hypothetical protein